MSPQTQSNVSKASKPSLPDLPPQEVKPEEATELSTRRKTAGRPSVSSDSVSSNLIGSGTRVVVPGLGKVKLVIH